MGRVWALIGAVVAALTVCLLLGGFIGSSTLLTASAPIGAGVVAAYLPGRGYISRGIWLAAGVLIGTLGYAMGATMFPDTQIGLWLGGVVPTLIIGLATMFTKQQSAVLAALLGSGSMTAVYAHVFDMDPQSLNVSAPIAIGQAMLPLGLGFLAGMVVKAFVAGDDDTAAAEPVAPVAPAEPESYEADGTAALDQDSTTQLPTPQADADATTQMEAIR